MAAALSFEEKLKQILAEEVERLYIFSDKLQQLLRERHNADTARDDQPTVEDLADRIARAEATINTQLSDLCQTQTVSRRDKGSQDVTGDRDSGVPPSPVISADMDAAKRQGQIFRNSFVRALPEILDPPHSDDFPLMEAHAPGEPTEHIDDASLHETS
ncbi:hypothetical protein ACOMHN_043599 [Nucella lapillus]